MKKRKDPLLAATKKQNQINEKLHDLQQVIDERISIEYLIQLTGIHDLSQIFHLILKVNTEIQSVYELGDMLPNLKTLVLDQSVISSVRDLGTSLKYLTSCSLSNCGLNDIDGIGVLSHLTELNLSHNNLSDVMPIATHENLETLNLMYNNVSDLSVGETLSTCPKLKSLTLSKNPLSKAPNYRIIMAYLIPGLSILDSSPVDPHAATKVSTSMIAETSFKLKAMEEELDDERRFENEIIQGSISSTTDTKSSAPFIGSMTSGAVPDTGSDLTHGSSIVLAGNMASAIRKRRNQLHTIQLAHLDNTKKPINTHEYRSSHRTTSTQSRPKITLDDNNDFESALEVLDRGKDLCSTQDITSNGPVLIQSSSPSFHSPDPASSFSSINSFFREGDITSSVLGASEGTPSLSSQFVKTIISRPASASMRNRQPSSQSMASSQESLNHLNNKNLLNIATNRSRDDWEEYCDESQPAGTISATASPNHRSNATPNRSKGGSPSTSSRANSLTNNRPKSSHPLTNTTSDKNLGIEPSTHSIMKLSERSNSLNLIEDHPPKSNSRTNSLGKLDFSSPNVSFKSNASTPRQRNSSRPQSAIIASSSESMKTPAFSLPFKVMVDDDQVPSHPIPKPHGLQFTAAGRGVSMDSQEDDESGGMDYPGRDSDSTRDSSMSWFHQTFGTKSVIKSTSNPSVGIAMGSLPRSIVHQDIVRRTMKTRGGRNPHETVGQDEMDSDPDDPRAFDDEDGIDDDDPDDIDDNQGEVSDNSEDIAIGHSDRFEMMNLSANASNNRNAKKNQSLLFAFSIHSNSNESNVEGHDKKKRDVVGESMQPDEKNRSKVIPNESVSSKVGKSLGFNLVGSLAAIDQWVQDMTSDDEKDEREEENRGQGGVRARNTLYNGHQSDLGREGKEGKILTRDSIINMCQNGSNGSNGSGNSSRKDRKGWIESDEISEDTHKEMPAVHGSPIPMTMAAVEEHKTVEKKMASSPRTIKLLSKYAAGLPNVTVHQQQDSSPTSSVNNLDVNDKEVETNRISEHLSVNEPFINYGKAEAMKDEELIELLRRPPKSTFVLRTKGNYQEFFRGISAQRMKSLLELAYRDMDNKQSKVEKRMELLKDVFT